MKKIKPNTFFLLSLGCSKNLVDSSSISTLLTQGGYSGTENPDQAEVLIVNTCGFIKPASDESFQELRNLAKQKKKGQLLIAAGCLTQRYREAVAEQVPGIDGIIGTRRWMDILDLIQQLRKNPIKTRYHIPDHPTIGTDDHGILRAAIQGNNAYLKIADGCRRACAYCAIPMIKGTQVSRPIDNIILEAKQLSSLGVKEIILIAQDTTDYGSDLGIKNGLAKLLGELTAQVPQIPWIRILYAFPGVVTDELIEVMSQNKQILHYLDIPLQHANPQILKKMRRPSNMDSVRRTIQKLRNAMPDIAIRTTFIVGFPGETETEFQDLLDFVEEIKFDHLGAFTYFQEKGTTAEVLGDPVTEEEKQNRLERLMTLQQDISLRKNQPWVGKELSILVEGFNEGISIGRSYRDAPEIDGLVFVEGDLPIGEICQVKITDALTHDLVGRPL